MESLRRDEASLQMSSAFPDLETFCRGSETSCRTERGKTGRSSTKCETLVTASPKNWRDRPARERRCNRTMNRSGSEGKTSSSKRGASQQRDGAGGVLSRLQSRVELARHGGFGFDPRRCRCKFDATGQETPEALRALSEVH